MLAKAASKNLVCKPKKKKSSRRFVSSFRVVPYSYTYSYTTILGWGT